LAVDPVIDGTNPDAPDLAIDPVFDGTNPNAPDLAIDPVFDQENPDAPDLVIDPVIDQENQDLPDLSTDPVNPVKPDLATDRVNTGKAYDGKGAKVLPILAKLQAKYESMNDQDKEKLLEKADTYRAKFKTVIDKIDDATALKYNLNRELINKILGLNPAGKLVPEVEEATVEEVEDPLIHREFTTEPVAPIEPVEQVEPVSQPEQSKPVYNMPPLEPVVIVHQPEEDLSMGENYDHLIIDHSQELLYPDTFNIDDLKEKPVYVEGEDQHYKEQFADSMQYIARTMGEGPRLSTAPMPVYPQNTKPLPSVYQQKQRIPNMVYGENYLNEIRRLSHYHKDPAAYRNYQPYNLENFYEPMDMYAGNQAGPYGYNVQGMRRGIGQAQPNNRYVQSVQLPAITQPEYDALMQVEKEYYNHQMYLQQRQQNAMFRY